MAMHRTGRAQRLYIAFGRSTPLGSLTPWKPKPPASREATISCQQLLLHDQALDNETGRPTIILDVGSLMGGLVGLTEDRTRQALAQIDAMAPAVVMIDEVEKALGGVASSGQTDGGVMSRLFGTLLTWLNDHDSDVFVICTCNDIAQLPPEFARAERFDGIYFVDLPDVAQRSAIWRIYVDQYGLDPQQPRPIDAVWTGAEIKACCRLAALLDCSLVEAAEHVVPVAQTAAEAVERLRSWADGRCLSADASGIYRKQAPPLPRPGRTLIIIGVGIVIAVWLFGGSQGGGRSGGHRPRGRCPCQF